MKDPIVRFVVILAVAVTTLACAQGPGPEAATGLFPTTPDGTVTVVAEKLSTHNPEVLWQALPESYRNDINQLTLEFAAKMDPEIYDRVMALAGRAIEVLQSKKALVFESATFKSTGADPAEIDPVITGTLQVAETFLTSEISTLVGLEAVNWENYLATTGSALMEQASAIETEDVANPLDDLESLTIETLEAADTTAKLKISAEGHDPEELDLVMVEDRWVPKELAEQWPEKVAEARTHLEEMNPENMAALKTQAMMGIGMAEGLIEQIAAVETAEEFDAAVGPLLQMVMGSVASAMPADGPETWDDEDAEEEE